MTERWNDLWENEFPESGQEAIVSNGRAMFFAKWVASISPVWRFRDGGYHKHWTEFRFWMPQPPLPALPEEKEKP